MHSKYQRRRPFPHAGLVWKRDTTVDIPVDTSSGGFVLTSPTTITFVHTVTETDSSSSSTATSSSSYSQSSSVVSTTSASSEQQQPTSSTSSFSISSQFPPQTFTSSSPPTISPTAGTDGDNNGTVPITSGALSSTQVPAGAIAAVVIACLIVIIVGAFYLIRSRSKRNRVKRRPLWTKSNGTSPFGISSETYEPKPSGFFDGPSNPLSPPPVPPLPQRTEPAPTTQFTGVAVTMPPTSYNNEITSADPSAITENPNLISTSKAVYSLGLNGKQSIFSATVTSTFITMLPDELSIDVGETLRVVAEYDDGWSLCMNAKGEQGMVPIECLDRVAERRELRAGVSMTSLVSTTASSQNWRGSRRVSSLRP